MILISPWARNTHEGKPSPKNYPYWAEVVAGLSKTGLPVLQVSCKGEPDIGGCERADDLRLSEIQKRMRECSTWISVDNFWHHMAWSIGEPGVVIFGSSDPAIFGHPENINLLKDPRFLRAKQFRFWSMEKPCPEMFVGPAAVVEAARLSIKKRRRP